MSVSRQDGAEGDSFRFRSLSLGVQDILNAYRNPIRAFDLEDLTMLIGPDQSARLVEGIATVDGIEFVIHAMPAQAKFLE